jgi:AraC-like DNA-binding protein
VWTAIPGRVIIVNPEDVHDGRPAARDEPYSYRMLYVDRDVLVTAIGEAAGRRVGTPTPFFAEPVVDDAALSERLRDVHRVLEREESTIARETALLTTLVELAWRHGGAPLAAEREPRARREAALARDYLAEHFAQECSLAGLAALAGINRFNLLRAFRRAYGLPPHRYQTQLRLRRAKQLLLSGESAARAAAAAGFSDQSHLIRTFKSVYGVTPGAITFNRRA